LSWRCLPEGPWLVRIALPSLLADGHATWQEFSLRAAHIVACAGFCRDVLIANGVPAERVTVLRQALPGQDRVRRLRLPLRCAGRPVRLGFFGRFTPVKGPDLLVEATRHLETGGVDAVAELVGPVLDGDRAWAHRILQQAGDRARYLGVKQGTDLTDWLTSLDLVVLPSRWLETGPLALLEAWNLGVPVIGTDLGGMRDFLTAANLTELLFAMNDPSAIAAAVRRVLEWDNGPRDVRVPGLQDLTERMSDIYRCCLSTERLH
jgi:glycosyltransferase involved in cell wall biosynthesis